MENSTTTTTLILIPGGRELSLPEHSEKFRSTVRKSLANKTAKIMMLANKPLIPEKVLHTLSKFKSVLLIESDEIESEDGAWRIATNEQADNYLPVVSSAGFDFQVIRMELVAVKYEDFEIVDRFASKSKHPTAPTLPAQPL
ncbi:MAG: hypothetical protein EOO88_50040 [Pedobacter sp.]|nr:MAG: hypothetical protein EOO88_50040 [Pedobacter sp.]